MILIITRKYYQQYKNEEYLPSLEIAVQIANFFKCTLDYLFGLENDYKEYYNQKFDISFFYLRYKNLLNKNNETHYSLSKKIEINNSSLAYWKKGATPRMESLIKLADYFGVSIDYLVGRED